MNYAVTSAQMKAADKYTIEQGTPSYELMDKASFCVYSQILSRIDSLESDTRVLIICGTGNNGGDGFGSAKYLAKAGYKTDIFILGKQDRMTPETTRELTEAMESGATLLSEFKDEDYNVVVDALFGVGLSRELEGEHKTLIDRVNSIRALKVAVDIPSGISADTGQILGAAFKADLTVTFAYVKLGHLIYPGKDYTGELILSDIGINGEPEAVGEYYLSPKAEDVKELVPVRSNNSNKGTFGKLLVIAGSRNMAGAAYLSALGALRTGTGLVTVYTPECNRTIIQTLIPEAVLATYEKDIDDLDSLLDRCDAVIAGPGLSQSDLALSILRRVLEVKDKPVILDADCLNLMALHKELMGSLSSNMILTPHIKEFSRLIGLEVSEILRNPVAFSKDFSEQYGCLLVLKSAATVCVYEGRKLAVNRYSSAALAKAGSGDVLTGVIGGLLCCKAELFEAAVGGVLLHSLSGLELGAVIGDYGVLAHETADHIPMIIKKYS